MESLNKGEIHVRKNLNTSAFYNIFKNMCSLAKKLIMDRCSQTVSEYPQCLVFFSSLSCKLGFIDYLTSDHFKATSVGFKVNLAVTIKY